MHARDKCYKGILTFGGAYSNHLHAAAYATKQANLKLICIVRAQDTKLDNPTMSAIKHWGAQINLVDRETYKKKEDRDYIDALEREYPDYFIVPEGGNNLLARKGMQEMAKELSKDYDYIFISVGTGSSAIGLVPHLNTDAKLMAVAAVKDSSLVNYFNRELGEHKNWELSFDFARGGFAKTDPELVKFINVFNQDHGILLDPIYNAKTFLAFDQLVNSGRFSAGSKILLIHTGGLQGIKGHNMRYASQPEMQIVT